MTSSGGAAAAAGGAGDTGRAEGASGPGSAGSAGNSGSGELAAFEYAVLRAVPRVDRGETINVGVVLYCQAADYLGCAIHLERSRLLALDPATDADAVQAALDAVRSVCAADPAAGAASTGSSRERFGWLTAPRSTVVQPGPVHSGLTANPAAHLQRLLERLVR